MPTWPKLGFGLGPLVLYKTLIWYHQTRAMHSDVRGTWNIQENTLSKENYNSQILLILNSLILEPTTCNFTVWAQACLSILLLWVWFSMVTGNWIGFGQSSSHPLLDNRWIVAYYVRYISALHRASCVAFHLRSMTNAMQWFLLLGLKHLFELRPRKKEKVCLTNLMHKYVNSLLPHSPKQWA